MQWLNSSRLISLMVLVLLFFYISHSRNIIWKNPRNLWTDVVRKSPMKCRSWTHLGRAYRWEGDTKTAIQLFKTAIWIEPHFSFAYLLLGDSYRDIGDLKSALSCYEQILDAKKIAWVHSRLYNNLGLTLDDLGEKEKAINMFRKGIELYPEYAPYYSNLGVIYSNDKKFDMAIDIYRKGIAVSEAWYLYHNLSEAYNATGNSDLGEWAFRKAVQLKRSEDQ